MPRCILLGFINYFPFLDWKILEIYLAIFFPVALFVQTIYFSFYAYFHNLVLSLFDKPSR